MWSLAMESLIPIAAAFAIGLATGWWLTRRRDDAPDAAPTEPQ